MSKHPRTPDAATPTPEEAPLPTGTPDDPGFALPSLGGIVLVQLATRPEPFPAIVTGLPGPGPYAVDCEVFGTPNGSHTLRAVAHSPKRAAGSWHWPPRA